jgi:hypothetical protein
MAAVTIGAAIMAFPLTMSSYNASTSGQRNTSR